MRAEKPSSWPCGSLVPLSVPFDLSFGLSCGLSRRDGVLRDAQHLAVENAVPGEIEGVDLDLGVLAGTDEADVAVGHHRLDLELAVDRHQHEQRLRRRHDAADGVDGELLHDAVDRRGQQLQLGPLLGLDQVLDQTRHLAIGLGEFAEARAPVFGDRPARCVSVSTVKAAVTSL